MAAKNTTVDLTKDQGFGFKANGEARLRAAPKSGTRTAKPVFAIIKYTDPNTGQPVKLDRDRLDITFEKDASNLVTLLTGEGMGDATVVKVDIASASHDDAGPSTSMPADQSEAPTA